MSNTTTNLSDTGSRELEELSATLNDLIEQILNLNLGCQACIYKKASELGNDDAVKYIESLEEWKDIKDYLELL